MLNTLRPRQNGRHFPDDIFRWIFLNENVWISIEISLKFVPRGPINYIPTLVQVMAWRRPGDKPLSEPMMVRLPTHICVTRPQWVNNWFSLRCSGLWMNHLPHVWSTISLMIFKWKLVFKFSTVERNFLPISSLYWCFIYYSTFVNNISSLMFFFCEINCTLYSPIL